MAYGGIQNTDRVTNLTLPEIYAKVVDSTLNSRTYMSRLMGRAEPMMGSTKNVVTKISRTNAGQNFVGLETLNIAAWSTKITLSYNHNAYTHPVPSLMQEAFANAGSTGIIDLDLNNLEEAKGELIQDIGSQIYGLGTSNQFNGLEMIVDDATNVDLIGGQSRATYGAPIKGYVLAATSGIITLAKMATVFDGCSAAGMAGEEPTIGITTKTIWSYIEQLISPQMRQNYGNLPVFADSDSASVNTPAVGQAYFKCLYFRGVPIIKDDACTAGVLYFINEKYTKFFGRTIVPDQYKDTMKKVDLGSPDTFTGTMADKAYMPSSANGFFYEDFMRLPQQAGKIARFYVFGQLISLQLRRNGKLTGITGN